MKRSRARCGGVVISLLWLFGGAGASAAEDSSYRKEVEAWRAEREASLEKDDGWLTIAGLYWLREGENWVGTDNENDFVLPEGSAPAVVGVFERHGGETTFRSEGGVVVTQRGVPVTVASLDSSGNEDAAISVGRLSMWVHSSGERQAIRLRDLDSTIRKEFTGLEWFPVDPAFRIAARFEAFAQPKEVEILNMLGDVERYRSPGAVEFELGEETVRMEPVLDSDGGLWFVFRDGTSGKESYAAARFLRADPPKDGTIVLDFNKAYNPPCAFNPHTTCPMPAKENRLRVPIPAGEKDYHKKARRDTGYSGSVQR